MSFSVPPDSPVSVRFRALLLGVLVMAAVLVFQWGTGVWTSDLGADPDEPAHAVTSLMIRDYLASGLGSSPLAFAQQYYADFPKVALGHYPPVYYGVGGVALLPWAQPVVLLVLQAVFIGLLAVQVYVLGRRFLREESALTAAILTVSFPVTLKLAQLIMADLLLACVCLWAVQIWVRFLDRPRVSTALLFGVVAAGAILTKGSALALALVPGVSVLLTGRWSLLKKPAFWLAGVTVGMLAGPWMMYSSKITQEGMLRMEVADFAKGALVFYVTSLPSSFGLPVMVMAILGLMLWVNVKRGIDPLRASLIGLLVGTLMIVLLVPAGFSTRYFMPVVAVVALLSVSLFDQMLSKRRALWVSLVVLMITVWSQYQVQDLPMKNVSGYRAAVLECLKREESSGLKDHWLVSADARGEGAVIGEAAFALPERVPAPLQVYRASKELSSSDWLGRDYQAAFKDAAAVRAHLDKLKVSHVFIELTEDGKEASAHEKLLLEGLVTIPWALMQEWETQRPYRKVPGRLQVYHRQPNP